MVLTVKALLVALLLGGSLLLLGLGLKIPIPGVAAMAAESLIGLLLPPAAFPLFVAGVLFLLCFRPAEAAAGRGTPSPRYVVTAVSGPLQGRSFPLSRQNPKLTFGREGCSVLFPSDTPGVGRYHCTVSLDGDTVSLRDENSTYGTFLMPQGQRVAPGYPVTLYDGMQFCLASPAVTFRFSEDRQSASR